MGNLQVAAVEGYAVKFSQKVCDDFFTMFKNTATGAEIMKISPVPQINYFVLFNLYESWKIEVAKLKSPYFNYEKPEVSNALKNFADLLSHNILISREHLEPLVKQAVSQTLNYAFYPCQTLILLLKEKTEKLEVGHLESWKKYFKIHSDVYDSFLTKAHLESKNHFDRETAIRILNSMEVNLNQEKTKQVIEDLLGQLSKISAITEHSIRPNVLSFQPEDKQKLTTENKTINEKFAKDQISVSDMEVRDYAHTPSRKEISNKILDIKSAITVNQKFMFINHLFKGEATEFDKAVSHINGLQTYDEAITHLLEKYALKYGWDTDNEQVEELFELVGRKFLNN